MIDFIKRHEQAIRERLAGKPDAEQLARILAHHEVQIARLQHERLAHLITMLFVCLFFLLSFGYTLSHFTASFILLTTVLLILSAAYILHYYRLENSVQRWYGLANEIDEMSRR